MILLVRHPPVGAGGRCYGRLDLEPDSACVARLAAEVLRLADRPWTLWTSPARRCRLVAEALGHPIVDHRLQELDFGAWEGVPWAEIPRASLDAWAADPWSFAPPSGESGRALVERVSAFAAVCAKGKHVVITHGGPLKVLVPVLQEKTVDLLAAPPPPSSITVVLPRFLVDRPRGTTPMP